MIQAIHDTGYTPNIAMNAVPSRQNTSAVYVFGLPLCYVVLVGSCSWTFQYILSVFHCVMLCWLAVVHGPFSTSCRPSIVSCCVGWQLFMDLSVHPIGLPLCYVVLVGSCSWTFQYILSVHSGCPEPSVNTDQQIF